MRERIEITPLWARNFLSETVGIEEPDLPRVYCYGDMYPWGGHMGQTLIRCAMQETNGTSFDLRKLYRSVCRQYIDAYEDVWHVKGFELEDEMMHFEMAVDAGDRNLNEIVRQRLNGQAISGPLPTPFLEWMAGVDAGDTIAASRMYYAGIPQPAEPYPATEQEQVILRLSTALR